jgi:hypothetical protein
MKAPLANIILLVLDFKDIIELEDDNNLKLTLFVFGKDKFLYYFFKTNIK